MRLSPAVLLTVTLLACKPTGDGGDGGSTSSADSSAGDDTFGMGVTSATMPDPSSPSGPTTDNPGTTPTSDPTTSSGPTTDNPGTTPTSDPTVPTLTSFTDGTDVDPTFPDCVVETAGCTNSGGEPSCPDPIGQPQDSFCSDSSGCGCASGLCFVVPLLGGWCGECIVDADCPGGGCTVPDPITSVGAVCNMGEAGAGCMTSDVCVDPEFPTCAVVFDIPDILVISTCSQCVEDSDCPPDAPNCTPVYDISHLTGQHECRPDASVPNDQGCSLAPDAMGQPSGNKACQSGFCGEISVMNLFPLGICGDCNHDSDCPQGQTCTPPMLDIDFAGLIGSVCE